MHDDERPLPRENTSDVCKFMSQRTLISDPDETCLKKPL